MTKSKIFLKYHEPETIHEMILKTKISSNNINEKIKKYIEIKAKQLITHHNNNIDYKGNEVYTLPFLPRYLFVVLITAPNTNHPYLLYVNLDDNVLYLLIPFGKDQFQLDLEYYWDNIEKATVQELCAMYLLIDKTIFIRKKGIIDSKQFTLLNCNNIPNCIKKFHEINEKNISESAKIELYDKYNQYYLNKAVSLLKFYFTLLENKKYDLSHSFLKGSESKYFGKKRLNTFFKNSKDIIGHLEIFITLYELLHTIRQSLLGY